LKKPKNPPQEMLERDSTADYRHSYEMDREGEFTGRAGAGNV
jgi:hypothetical protein